MKMISNINPLDIITFPFVVLLLCTQIHSCLSLKNESNLITRSLYNTDEKYFENDLFGSELFSTDAYDALSIICSNEDFAKGLSSREFRKLCPDLHTHLSQVRELLVSADQEQNHSEGDLSPTGNPKSKMIIKRRPGGPVASVTEDGEGGKAHKILKRALEQFVPFTSSSSVSDKQIKPPEDLYLLTPDLIRQYGYPMEVHDIRTSDGYYLTLHRIVGTRHDNTTTRGGRAVLLLHGFAGSSADYVIGGPDSALGFMLADASFDVWMGNFRGNTYSKKHASLNTANADYWKFSLDDVARRDVPAMVAHILNTTRQKSIASVGYCVGATLMTMASFIKPKMAKKIHYFAAMAPVGFGKMSTGPVKVMTNFARITYKHAEATGGKKAEVLARDRDAIAVLWFFCNGRSVTWKLCLSLLTASAGINSGLFRKELLPYILAHFPAGTSARLAAHMGQLLSTDGVQFFDLGSDRNIKVYGSAQPLEYDMKHLTCPVAVYWAENDLLAPPQDIQKFISSLPNVVEKMLVGHETFNHYDFVYSNQARHLVHTDLIETLRHYDQENSRND